ncbi:hypothetical protein ACHAXS_003730 [Conticribra weissflogii]
MLGFLVPLTHDDTKSDGQGGENDEIDKVENGVVALTLVQQQQGRGPRPSHYKLVPWHQVRSRLGNLYQWTSGGKVQRKIPFAPKSNDCEISERRLCFVAGLAPALDRSKCSLIGAVLPELITLFSDICCKIDECDDFVAMVVRKHCMRCNIIIYLSSLDRKQD